MRVVSRIKVQWHFLWPNNLRHKRLVFELSSDKLAKCDAYQAVWLPSIWRWIEDLWPNILSDSFIFDFFCVWFSRFFSKTILQVSFQLSIFTQSLQRSWSLKQALWSAEWKTERIKTKLEFWWGGRYYTFSKIQHTWNKRLLSNRTVYCLVLFGAPLFLFLIRVHFIAILQPL